MKINFEITKCPTVKTSVTYVNDAKTKIKLVNVSKCTHCFEISEFASKLGTRAEFL